MRSQGNKLFYGIYDKLYSHFGPQRWWPAKTPFEVMVGAILTQNTSWVNVEKAIINLKKNKALSARRLYDMPQAKIAGLIRPAGYYNIKAKRLKKFLEFFFEKYQGNIEKMRQEDASILRRELLLVNGIGPETADSMLLYALGKPVFVVDAYTKRMLSRHKIIKEDFSYEQVQGLFMNNLVDSAQLFNEYHALIVKLGKDFCMKRRPKCEVCPLESRKH